MKSSKLKFRGFAAAGAAILFGVSALLGACTSGTEIGGDDGNGGDEGNGGDGGNTVVTPNVVYGDATIGVDTDSLYTDGVHSVSVTARTNDYLVRDGKTDYAIVYPENATDRENTAVSELQTYFQAATGITLATISDASAVYSNSARYISVGATSFVEAAGIAVDADVLGQSGARVVTKDYTIFLTGAYDYGTLYAVYEFLGYVFDWEVYSDTVITYNENVTEVPLMDFDVTEVPDFEFNAVGSLYIRNDEDLMNRFRMIKLQDQAFGYGDNIYHNSLEWLPTATYKSAHPKWYSSYGNNLCYYAQGDEEEYEALVAEVASLMKERIKANPGKIYISFGIQDTQTLCNCIHCQEMRAKYNDSDAAGVILMLNDVYSILQEWFDGDGAQYYCGQKILFFAYHATNTPPVSLNAETGEYESLLIDPDDPEAGTFSCENIVPWFAETNGDYLYSLLENESINGSIAENLKGWGAISDEILFWTYGTNFSYYLTPYYSFEGFQKTYQFAADEGVRTLYAQHQTTNANSTGWERLKGYLNYKLAWNVNYNVNELIERFFENYFGPAAEEMLDLFNEYRVVGHTQMENGYAVRRSIFANPLQASYWPRNSLVDWMGNIDAALEAIADVSDDLYDVYYSNIATERIWVLYLMVNIYSSSLSTDTVTQYRTQIKEDCTLAGIDYVSEQVAISTLWSQWGLN